MQGEFIQWLIKCDVIRIHVSMPERRRGEDIHVGSLDAHHSAGEPLQLSSRQGLYITLPKVSQVCPATPQTRTKTQPPTNENRDVTCVINTE